MQDALNRVLESFRNHARTEREKGTYFERLAVAFLKNDPLQQAQYADVWTYAEWAEQHGIDRRDTGIDLVASLREGEGLCAVQCKFYDADGKVSRKEIDSFISASGRAPFVRRLIIDTTNAEWTEHAEQALREQHVETMRIGLADLAESRIDWSAYLRDERIVLVDRKELRPDQKEALEAVTEGLSKADRGKLLMACGTGKTFTSLKIAETIAGNGGRVLFLVPSLSLMSQTVREWTGDSEVPIRSFAVCSDTQVGKRRQGDDVADLEIHDLAFPATTDAQKLAMRAATDTPDQMTVVFSTYQSIQVVSDAQQSHGLPEFDLIICDEAHRTTGVIFSEGEESHFVKVHRQEFIAGKKRLYMTATPRIYGDGAKTKANEASVELCSMDDLSLYGEVLFARGFSWAVQNGLLTDYKVIVLAVDEAMVSAGVQKRLTDANNSLVLDDATKIIGCYKALTKADLKDDVSYDPQPMRRALAFCKDIRSSKLIASEFAAVADEFRQSGNIMDGFPGEAYNLDCEVRHVDGTFNAKSRTMLLEWLKAATEGDTCRVLSNARCLSEGVDVPALDAIMFLHPRKSQIDVVQSVGRVMRRAEGKRMGYVILPVGIPAGVQADEALNNNEKYRVVWQILNALRAHDDRFDATINKMELGVDVSDQIEVIAVTDQLPNKSVNESTGLGIGDGSGEEIEEAIRSGEVTPYQQSFLFDEFTSAIRAKIVKKCGRRTYWEDWAVNIAEIAQTHITRLTGMLSVPCTPARKAFDDFVTELRDDLNDSLTEGDAIEMLAQHIITRPVFQVLFEGHEFTRENPVSRAMQRVLDILDEANLDKESRDLEKFYASVRVRASGITEPHAKQRLVVELYDKFFRKAFPRTTERLGIVYTPVEIVDFIIHSVNEVLQKEFGQTLGSEGVHIIDPFTGTGTFITRLLQSGLIEPEELERKYREEIHANEIVLLAYYIAAINIEAVYHGIAGGDYVPFEGICLTDSFQMYESDDLISHYMPDNSERRKRQKAQDIKVIVGNPPYSSGQGSANDNAANVHYPSLDARIAETYAAGTSATLKNSLYDSYIRAIRWGSDRLGYAGVMAFVTNAGWIDGNAADGLRACLAHEFSNIYVFHLRGNQRTSGERSRREGGKVFGSGSRAPIAITVFVKNPLASKQGQIWFHDIGDYLGQQDKLDIIRRFGSIGGISNAGEWLGITPDSHSDWLNQRDETFYEFIEIGNKSSAARRRLFVDYSGGVETQRDSWCYNASKEEVELNIRRTLSFYNSELERYEAASTGGDVTEIAAFTNNDPSKISWTRALRKDLEGQKPLTIGSGQFMHAVYRPFSNQWLYFSRRLNEMVYQMPRIFPHDGIDNRAICITGPGGGGEFSTLLVDRLPNRHTMSTGQCFPLKLFEVARDDHADGLFADENAPTGYRTRDGITDIGLEHFLGSYPGEAISKEDVFYYVYGLLHSQDYRSRYADNLAKDLPRIPCVKKAEEFWAFSRAGRALGELHIGYEGVEPYPVTIKEGDLRLADIKNPEAFFRVEKMRFGGKRPNIDKTTVNYNSNITMQDIPLEAYDYVVNGKPALEWVMERQVVKTDKASGIVNDANRYAIETVGDPAYPLRLFQRVITVSLETMNIVNSLPPLDIDV